MFLKLFPDAAFVFFLFFAKSPFQIYSVHVGKRADVDEHVGQFFGDVPGNGVRSDAAGFSIFAHGGNDFPAFFRQQAAFVEFVGCVETPFSFHLQDILLKIF